MTYSKRVTLNIAGEIYETYEKTLNRFPDTLLGTPKKRNLYYSTYLDEYFFNRNRKCFEAILFFYQSWGMLRCPHDVALEIFEDECRFFELPDDIIKSMTLKAGILPDLQQPMSYNGENTTIRERLWNIMEHPESSIVATVYTFISLSAVVLSIVLAIIETAANNKYKSVQNPKNPWFLTELLLNTWFLSELTVRFLICPSKRQFIRGTFNWIDALAVCPYFIMLIFAPTNVGSLRLLRIFRLVRVMRLFKFSKQSKRLQIVGEIVSSSLGDLQLLLLCLCILVILAGSMIYYIELKRNTDFDSIPECIWWGIVTVTTVGYGDVSPTTLGGKVFAACYMTFGAITMTLPILSIVAKFELYYEKNISTERTQQERDKYMKKEEEKDKKEKYKECKIIPNIYVSSPEIEHSDIAISETCPSTERSDLDLGDITIIENNNMIVEHNNSISIENSGKMNKSDIAVIFEDEEDLDLRKTQKENENNQEEDSEKNNDEIDSRKDERVPVLDKITKSASTVCSKEVYDTRL